MERYSKKCYGDVVQMYFLTGKSSCDVWYWFLTTALFQRQLNSLQTGLTLWQKLHMPRFPRFLGPRALLYKIANKIQQNCATNYSAMNLVYTRGRGARSRIENMPLAPRNVNPALGLSQTLIKNKIILFGVSFPVLKLCVISKYF